MALPPEFREILTKILHNAAKILDKHLQELILAQNSLILDHEVFLVPPEIIADPRYLTLELNRKSSEFSKTILELLGEWQFIRISKQIDDLKAPWESSQISANFSRKILDRILIDNAKKHRLIVLTAPFKISPSCVASLREDLEIELAEDLRMFLSDNYPLDSEECPIEFYSDHFYNTISNDDIHQLQTILTNIPTLILHSSISDYKAYFHLNFWLPYSKFIVSYTLPVWPWEEACEILKASGKEEKIALRIIRQIIISIQEFLASFISDWYYLHLNPYYSPKLLQPHNILTTQYFDTDLLAPYIDLLKKIQSQQQLTNENLLKIFSNQQKSTSKKLIQKVKEWSLSSVLTTHSGCVHSLAFNSDRSILLSGGSDSVVRLWHPSTGKVSLSLKGHIGDVFAVAVSGNDKYFASSGSDCKVLVWNLGKLQEPVCFNEHSAYVSSLVFCPDNRLLASGSYDNSIHIWDLWSSKTFRVLTGHSSYVTSLAFNTKGDLLASGSYDCSIRLWNPSEKKSKHTLTGHTDYVNCIAFSPFNDLLASGSRDGTIRLWRPETGTTIAILKGHTAGVNSLTFSPNGDILVSGSSDRSVRLWNTKIGEEIGILTVGSHPILCVHFSKDGKQLAMGSSWTDNIKIWNCN